MFIIFHVPEVVFSEAENIENSTRWRKFVATLWRFYVFGWEIFFKGFLGMAIKHKNAIYHPRRMTNMEYLPLYHHPAIPCRLHLLGGDFYRHSRWVHWEFRHLNQFFTCLSAEENIFSPPTPLRENKVNNLGSHPSVARKKTLKCGWKFLVSWMNLCRKHLTRNLYPFFFDFPLFELCIGKCTTKKRANTGKFIQFPSALLEKSRKSGWNDKPSSGSGMFRIFF